MTTRTARLQAAIRGRIVQLRDKRVMLDADLAELYGVETRVLVQAVKRNLARFPADFMFRTGDDELEYLRSQNVISSARHGGRRTLPYVFTEQGVAMLSSVLNSTRAIAVNVEIMRTFVRMRELAMSHAEVSKRLMELEARTVEMAAKHEGLSRDTKLQLRQVFGVLRQLMTEPEPVKRPIGFVPAQERQPKARR